MFLIAPVFSVILCQDRGVGDGQAIDVDRTRAFFRNIDDVVVLDQQMRAEPGSEDLLDLIRAVLRR